MFADMRDAHIYEFEKKIQKLKRTIKYLRKQLRDKKKTNERVTKKH